MGFFERLKLKRLEKQCENVDLRKEETDINQKAPYKPISLMLRAYAKINIALDVVGKREDGYHEVNMIMQEVFLHDEVLVSFFEKDMEEKNYEDFWIVLNTSKPFLPTDENNIAYRAADLMHQRYASDRKGKLSINIRKNIPVAAGLAGGSSNAAAVIHALNVIWKLGLSLQELCEIGAELGADVPFCIMGQARANTKLPDYIKQDKLATTCALATGIGTDLTPIKPFKSFFLLSKPSISIATKEVYNGLVMDNINDEVRPNVEKAVEALKTNDYISLYNNVGNVLEMYTLHQYPSVAETKAKMEELNPLGITLMSGSGPTVFTTAKDMEKVKKMYPHLKKLNKETLITRTLG